MLHGQPTPRTTLIAWVSAILGAIALPACSSGMNAAPGGEPDRDSDPDEAQTPGENPRQADDDASPARACVPPSGTTGSPRTIDEAVALINALLTEHGAPLTLPCFLESLDRPLRMNATRSRISAQPAVNTRSPRLFLSTQDMWLSVVPEGFGRPFLELGQLTSRNRSIKAEIEFPVHEPLTRESPYERLAFGAVTTCGLCHSDEKPVLGIPNAVESEALRPPHHLDVSLEDVRREHATCDGDEEPDRCTFLDAIFEHGATEHLPFPDDMPTIFDRQ